MKKLPEEKTNRSKPSKETVAMQTLLEELFADMQKNRKQLYMVNFIRGICYGFGAALGGTVVLGIAFWVLGWFIDWPYVGQFIEQLIKK